MSSVLRFMNQPEPQTVAELVAKTGLGVKQIREELVQLEKDGKVVRQRAPVGKPHLWLRATQQGIDPLTVLLLLAVAADYHTNKNKLRKVMHRLASKCMHPTMAHMIMLAASRPNPHNAVWLILESDDLLTAVQEEAGLAVEPGFRKANPEETKDVMAVAEHLAKSGIRFVCMPVFDDEDFKAKSELAKYRLEQIAQQMESAA